MKLRNLWLAALIGVAAVVAPSQSADHNSELALQGPDHYWFTVGDVKLTALSDGTVPQDLHVLLRATTNERRMLCLSAVFFPILLSHNAICLVGLRTCTSNVSAQEWHVAPRSRTLDS
jgi:hypothetical protein